MGIFSRKEKYSGNAKQGEYIDYSELQKRESSGVTTYRGETPGQKISNIKTGIRQAFVKAKATAPERIAARKEFFRKAGGVVSKAGSVVSKVGSFGNNDNGRVRNAARGINRNLERNARNSPSNNIFTQGSGSNPFTSSDSSARNIFTVGSGNNPFDFSNKEKAIKNKGDSITIRIKR